MMCWFIKELPRELPAILHSTLQASGNGTLDFTTSILHRFSNIAAYVQTTNSTSKIFLILIAILAILSRNIVEGNVMQIASAFSPLSRDIELTFRLTFTTLTVSLLVYE